jgi:hypothetical protein
MSEEKEYTGGSVSYYSVDVTHPLDEASDPYTAECQDIIEALKLDFNEGNVLKAIWRRAAARLGKSKKGYTDGLYDAEKVVFYGQRLVEIEQRERRAAGAVQEKFDFVPAFKEGMAKADATHRDSGGSLFKQEQDTGRWMQWGNGHWFYHSDDATNAPSNLKLLLPEGVTVTGRTKVPSNPEPHDPPKADPFGPRDANGWYTWNGDDTMRPAGEVEVIYRSGVRAVAASEILRWQHIGCRSDVVKWRPAQ